MVSSVASPSARAPQPPDTPGVGTPRLQPNMIELSTIDAIIREREEESVRKEKITPYGRRNIWHVHNRWGLFAWIEFALKIAAVLAALISLTTIRDNLKISLLRVVEIALFAPLVLGLVLPLYYAFHQKESFDFVFVAATFVGHLAVIFVLLFGNTGVNLVVFCTLMCVGDFFRLVFVEATPPRMLPATFTLTRRRVLIGYVFFYIVIYVAVLAMETMTLIDENRAFINYNIISV